MAEFTSGEGDRATGTEDQYTSDDTTDDETAETDATQDTSTETTDTSDTTSDTSTTRQSTDSGASLWAGDDSTDSSTDTTEDTSTSTETDTTTTRQSTDVGPTFDAGDTPAQDTTTGSDTPDPTQETESTRPASTQVGPSFDPGDGSEMTAGTDTAGPGAPDFDQETTDTGNPVTPTGRDNPFNQDVSGDDSGSTQTDTVTSPVPEDRPGEDTGPEPEIPDGTPDQNQEVTPETDTPGPGAPDFDQSVEESAATIKEGAERELNPATQYEDTEQAETLDRSVSELSEEDQQDIAQEYQGQRVAFAPTPTGRTRIFTGPQAGEAAEITAERSQEAQINQFIADVEGIEDRGDVSVEGGEIQLSEQGQEGREQYVREQFADRFSEQIGAEVQPSEVSLTRTNEGFEAELQESDRLEREFEQRYSQTATALLEGGAVERSTYRRQQVRAAALIQEETGETVDAAEIENPNEIIDRLGDGTIDTSIQVGQRELPESAGEGVGTGVNIPQQQTQITTQPDIDATAIVTEQTRQQYPEASEAIQQQLQEQYDIRLSESDIALSTQGGQVVGTLSQEGEESVAVDQTPLADTPIGGLTTTGARLRQFELEQTDPFAEGFRDVTPTQEDVGNVTTDVIPGAETTAETGEKIEQEIDETLGVPRNVTQGQLDTARNTTLDILPGVDRDTVGAATALGVTGVGTGTGVGVGTGAGLSTAAAGSGVGAAILGIGAVGYGFAEGDVDRTFATAEIDAPERAPTTGGELQPGESVQGQSELSPGESTQFGAEINVPEEPTAVAPEELGVPREAIRGGDATIQGPEGTQITDDGEIIIPAGTTAVASQKRYEEDEEEEEEDDDAEEDEEEERVIVEVPEEFIPDEEVTIGEPEEETVEEEEVEQEGEEEIEQVDELPDFQGEQDAFPDETQADEDFAERQQQRGDASSAGAISGEIFGEEVPPEETVDGSGSQAPFTVTGIDEEQTTSDIAGPQPQQQPFTGVRDDDAVGQQPAQRTGDIVGDMTGQRVGDLQGQQIGDVTADLQAQMELQGQLNLSEMATPQLAQQGLGTQFQTQTTTENTYQTPTTTTPTETPRTPGKLRLPDFGAAGGEPDDPDEEEAFSPILTSFRDPISGGVIETPENPNEELFLPDIDLFD